MTASRNISMFFNELAAASYKILRKNGNLFKKKKMCNCFLELCPLNKYFEVKKQIKIKMMEMYLLQEPIASFQYFWLNYCNENHHIERIPMAVKNMDHLFPLASEIIEADGFLLFLLSDGT